MERNRREVFVVETGIGVGETGEFRQMTSLLQVEENVGFYRSSGMFRYREQTSGLRLAVGFGFDAENPGQAAISCLFGALGLQQTAYFSPEPQGQGEVSAGDWV